ncbi:efflux RND transporter periplasmic adaptor subunit [Phenylobacterium sp.]|uniref:efflux RND transporter periplasmic adaptor subunit n=1 Tax=Phenylobacterium sp. TaxID=1871053 RepID=UPI0027330A75|nr:efflux RND transporter periplasmic adaptor subunit [Phenylobacterium sp.]MDP3853799.1 efflux RND transporter periplasmic adaptor subunit [Phenylobacterium sp.]
MIRRHFFLVGALVVLALMVVAGGWKLTLGKKEGPGGPPGAAMAAQKGGGGPTGKGGGGRGPGGGGGPAQVSVALVVSKVFIDSIDVIGVAKGRQSVTLTAAATQLVDRVRFTDGQAVAKGAVLVELKDTEQNAGLAQAQARLVQAQRDFDRWKALAAQGYASKTALDQREATYLAARADVQAAQARQADRTIRAPFAGVVGLSDIAPGALINPGAAIVTLDDVSAVRVDFEVPDRYLASLREGQLIYAKTDAYPGETIQGRIAKLDSRIDERTRSITARAEFANPGRKLKPGMMMRVAISRGQRQALAAPEAAVAVQGDSAFVYVLAKRGEATMAEQRPVITGVRQDGFVEIREGVAAGDRIVADGLNKIQPGQPVRIASQGGRPSGASQPGARGPRPGA